MNRKVGDGHKKWLDSISDIRTQNMVRTSLDKRLKEYESLKKLLIKHKFDPDSIEAAAATKVMHMLF